MGTRRACLPQEVQEVSGPLRLGGFEQVATNAVGLSGGWEEGGKPVAPARELRDVIFLGEREAGFRGVRSSPPPRTRCDGRSVTPRADPFQLYGWPVGTAAGALSEGKKRGGGGCVREAELPRGRFCKRFCVDDYGCLHTVTPQLCGRPTLLGEGPLPFSPISTPGGSNSQGRAAHTHTAWLPPPGVAAEVEASPAARVAVACCVQQDSRRSGPDRFDAR